MTDLIVFNDLDRYFNKYGYKRFATDRGFFYLEASTDKAVLFDIGNKTVKVYDYETFESREIDFILIDLIYTSMVLLDWD